MNRKMCLAAVVIWLVSAGGGCSRLAKEALGGVSGGKGSFTVLRDASGGAMPESLAAYGRFQLLQLSDGVNRAAVRANRSFEKELAKKKIPNAASRKLLLVRGKIIHYEAAGLSGQLFGPLEEVVARIEFVDGDTGEVIAEVNCVGRTKSTTSQGVATKAQGLAKAIVGYIDQRYPQDQRLSD